jgi:hypothetical protein
MKLKSIWSKRLIKPKTKPIELLKIEKSNARFRTHPTHKPRTAEFEANEFAQVDAK